MKKESIIFNSIGVFFILLFCYVGYTIPEMDVINFVCLASLVSLCVFAMYINYDFNKLN
jgi:hypothetical protein